MASWKCGHRRAVINRALGETSTRELEETARFYGDAPGSWGEQVAIELRQRRQKCPACREQDGRNRNHWAALALVAVVVLLVAWGLHV